MARPTARSASATFMWATPPAAPDELSAQPPASGAGGPLAAAPTVGVRLTWRDKSNNESGFVIERSRRPDFSSIDASFFRPANTTTFLDTTAPAGAAEF